MNYNSKKIAEKLDRIREEKGISKTTIWKALNLTHQTLDNKLASGKFYLDEFLGICEVLAISPGEIFSVNENLARENAFAYISGNNVKGSLKNTFESGKLISVLEENNRFLQVQVSNLTSLLSEKSAEK